MSKHLVTKHKLLKIHDRELFESIMNRAMLSTKDKDIMRMHYIEDYDFYYIADELGYSRSGIQKRHQKILEEIKQYL